MRILLVSHPPLSPEFGAAQLALELRAALAARGHEAVVWSPEPLPARTPWWQHFRAQQRGVEAYLRSTAPFDVVDLPAVSITPRVRELSRVLVARSIQPDLLYFKASLRDAVERSHLPSPWLVLDIAQGARISSAIRHGFERADLLLCLGQLEERWMADRFPQHRAKLAHYSAALREEDRVPLAAVRARRASDATASARPGTRFLWIGRFTAHKGPRTFLRWVRERAKSHPDDSFTIAGCGEIPPRETPRDLIDRGCLRVIPSFRRSELPALLAAHDAGVFTSEAEGWGLSLHEMIESGMPIFATSAGGVVDLAEVLPQTVREFPPPAEVLPAPPAELEESGYFERFSWPRIAADYERLLIARFADRWGAGLP